MSTGEGKPRELDARTTVFKRDPESRYLLKMKASRYAGGGVGVWEEIEAATPPSYRARTQSADD